MQARSTDHRSPAFSWRDRPVSAQRFIANASKFLSIFDMFAAVFISMICNQCSKMTLFNKFFRKKPLLTFQSACFSVEKHNFSQTFSLQIYLGFSSDFSEQMDGEKLNLDNIISRLLEGEYFIDFSGEY